MPDAPGSLTEIDPEDPDIAFGLCDLGMGCPELGSVSLSELESVRGKLGLPIERDLHFTPTKTTVGLRRDGEPTNTAESRAYMAIEGASTPVAFYNPRSGAASRLCRVNSCVTDCSIRDSSRWIALSRVRSCVAISVS